MRTPPPTLLPILRSQVQGDLLAATYLSPGREYSITELARLTSTSVKAVHQEVSRLVKTGFLADRRMGTSRLIRSVQDTPLARPLTDLLAVTYGPLPVLTQVLGEVEGVDHAYIYGSWAARYRGEAGAVPNDVDVLVVGSADADVLDACARKAETALRRPVNIRRVRPTTWHDGSDPFIATVRSRPMVQLHLNETEDTEVVCP